MEISGRTVLLTGASGGLGGAIARALHAHGATVIATGRNAEQLAALEAETGARPLVCDLADRAEVERLLVEVGDEVDVLVANAALPGTTHGLEIEVEEIDRTLDVNLRAPMRLATELGRRMAARGSGHIVFVSSLNGKTASPRSAIYSATKFGLRGFGQALRWDLRGTGVGVTVVFPGFVRDAGMFADSGAKLPGFVSTVNPQQCADAVVRGIERNRGEIDVAPLPVRWATALASLAPGAAGAIQRRLGAEKIADDMAAAAVRKR